VVTRTDAGSPSGPMKRHPLQVKLESGNGAARMARSGEHARV
jgi:hypothetical protein